MDEALAGAESRDLLGWNTAIAAANPQVVWFLASRELCEEFRVFFFLFGGPSTIVLEDAVMRFLKVGGHAALPRSGSQDLKQGESTEMSTERSASGLKERRLQTQL